MLSTHTHTHTLVTANWQYLTIALLLCTCLGLTVSMITCANRLPSASVLPSTTIASFLVVRLSMHYL